MDALSAPIQAMSQAEKREKAMKDMGIDEKDISDVPVVSREQAKASKVNIYLLSDTVSYNDHNIQA